MKDIRNYEKLFIKLLKIKCDGEFVRICLIYNLTPKFVKYKLWNKAYMKKKIYQQHQRHYLQFEYHNKFKQVYKLEAENKKLLLTINTKTGLRMGRHGLKQKEETKIKSIHKDKIQRLSKGNVELEQVDIKKVVHNISSRELSAEEESILSK
ncbi:unnamed protein product, partial [Rotaria sp. Silwood1]